MAILRTTMDSLALELLEEIIGHVDEKDDISHFHLLACSLVCRFWLPSSQRRLFRHINLKRRPLQLAKLHAQIQRLDQVLLNSPHLTSYILVLELPDLSSCELSTYDHPGSPSWIAIDNPLPPLLRKLTHVQKLTISGLAWSDLPGDFRQSLCQVLELTSMAFVCINEAIFTRTDDFTNFINHARGLTGLSLILVDVSWVPRRPLETKQGEDNNQMFERNRIHLTSLHMRPRWRHNNPVFINWLLGPRSHLDVSHIHTLHIGHPDAGDASVNRLLRAIGSSLKHVSIIQPYSSKACVFVNLAFNVNIEVLSLVDMDMRGDSLSTLRRVLSTIDASNRIHHMELRMDPLGRVGGFVDWAAWEEVYSVLAGPHFQFLRVLYINIEPEHGAPDHHPHLHGDPVVEMSKDMVARHPSLATRGVRVCSEQINSYHCCVFCSDNPWN
ncbi:hypothetical protein JB92DRAFT_3042054 [Gautieria morchelliformis]|nr:hypothetical protein JB92DRAFT_3042054 [Gautieria morchelliformis]